MNFKTTILLILCLAIAGAAVYFTRNHQPAPETAPTAPKLIDWPSSDIAKLTIAPADDKQIVLQKQGTKWQMLEPVNAPADSSTVDELVSSLTNLESHGKVDASGADGAVTGLASPRYRIEITDKSGKTIKLAIGKQSGVGDELYVKKDGDSQADRVSASLYAELDKPASSFRDLKLVDVETPQIKSIEVKNGTESFELKKNGANWEVAAGPTTMPADESETSDLTMGVSGLRATEFVKEKSEDPKRYGLDNPQLVVTYTAEPLPAPGTTQPATQKAETGTIKFGRYQDLRKQNVFAQVSGSNDIAIVPAYSMTKFDKKPLDLRDKNVLKIDKDAVESISITTNKPATTKPTTKPAEESTVTIVRNNEVPSQPWHAPLALPNSAGATTQATTAPASAPATMATTGPTTAPTTVASTEPTTKPASMKWELTAEGKKGPADESTVDALLNQLTPLRAEKFLEKNPTSQPSEHYTLTITTKNGTDTIKITDPGESKNPIADYNGLTFEVSRFFLEKLTAKFTPGSNPPSIPGMPGVQ